jgi:hypothetical protein
MVASADICQPLAESRERWEVGRQWVFYVIAATVACTKSNSAIYTCHRHATQNLLKRSDKCLVCARQKSDIS